MASQIAHIVYAKKYFDRLEAGEISVGGKIDRDEFLLGCVFPDIRRIDKSVKRKDTHLRFDPLDLNFSGLTSFEAGWKFHLYCDMRREEILNRKEFYSLENTFDFCGVPAKLLEDELLYGEYDNWEKICFFFNNAPFVETNIGASPETFNLWYAILAKYIEKNPDSKTEKIFLTKQSSFIDIAEKVIISLEKLRENKKAVEILLRVKEEIT